MKKLTTYFAGAAVAAISMATIAALSVTASADSEKIEATVGSDTVKYNTFKEVFEDSKVSGASAVSIKLTADVTPTKADWGWNSGADITITGDKTLDLSSVAFKASKNLTLNGVTLKGGAISVGGDVTLTKGTIDATTVKGTKGHSFIINGTDAKDVKASIEGFDKIEAKGKATLTGNSKKSAAKVDSIVFSGGEITLKDGILTVNDISVTDSSKLIVTSGYVSGVVVLKNDIEFTTGKTLTLSGADTDTNPVIAAGKAKNVSKITIADGKALSATKGLYSVMATVFEVTAGGATSKVAQWSDVASLIEAGGGDVTVKITGDTPAAKITLPKADKYTSLSITGTSGKAFKIIGGLSFNVPTTIGKDVNIKSLKTAGDEATVDYTITSKSDITLNEATIDEKVKGISASKLTLTKATITAGKVAANELVVTDDSNINANGLAVKKSIEFTNGKKITFKFVDAKAYTEITDAKTLLKLKLTVPQYIKPENIVYGDGATYVFAASGKNMVLVEKAKAAILYHKNEASGTDLVYFSDLKLMPKYLKTASTAEDDWTVAFAGGAADNDTTYDAKSLYFPLAGTAYKSFMITKTSDGKKFNVDLTKCKLATTVRFDTDNVSVVGVPSKAEMQKFIVDKTAAKSFKNMVAVFA